ncbi:MAG: hypothetical protein KAU90_06490, partial [Sulfurovaceae bacterium]|nr:hypothetical protein [Sulfurovaceae bacterium]
MQKECKDIKYDFDENEEPYYLIFSNCITFLENAKIESLFVFITLLENKDELYEIIKKNENINEHIQPIFLKKMEDLHKLIEVLKEDLIKKETVINKSFPYLKIYIPSYNISKIEIKNFFSIKELKLNNLADKQEIYIVGENGDGKTLLLQSIVVGIKGTLEDGLKEFRAIDSKSKISITENEKNILAYGSSRNNSCQIKEDSTGYLTLFSGEYNLKSPIKWLTDLYNAQNAKEPTVISLESAIKLFKYLLNREIEIEVTYKDVRFKEKGSEVTFEQLSAGYKGVITIICDMIARLSEKQQVKNIR